MIWRRKAEDKPVERIPLIIRSIPRTLKCWDDDEKHRASEYQSLKREEKREL